jgi:tRNA-uridine 2-sulfurtransferase
MDLSVFDTNDLAIGSRVVVAMSGGVDSSLTAAALHKMGYEVIGVTLKLYEGEESSCSTGKKCCASRDIEDARKVAEAIGFPHYVINYQSRFGQAVVDYFVDSYAKGETPLPCVKCNQSVKFVDLLDCARKLNADALATGHYVKRAFKNGKAEMHRPHDAKKDQTYFLFATTQEQLNFLRFPLGGIDKSRTREYAEYFGLVTASKPDSQDICFVPDGDYAKFISKVRPDIVKSGEIINEEGKKLGEHTGTINYTIGQRRGVGVSHSQPLFVVKINTSNNSIVVGPKESLKREFVQIKEINLLESIENIKKMTDVYVKIRSTHDGVGAEIYDVMNCVNWNDESVSCSSDYERVNSVSEDSISKDSINENMKIVIKLKSPEFGVAPGQACVLYSGDRVIGGGWIEKSW